MSNHPTIAIIGGGPAGLTLARILHVHGIPSTVFERDSHPLARPQGGSLDLHADTGQRALQLAGLEQAFLGLARYEDQEGRVYSPDGKLLFHDAGANGDRPEIDRTQLRQLLLDALPQPIVRWGQKVDAIQPLSDGGYAVAANGRPPEAFDLVVGADGAWSRVRPLVSDAAPYYEGVLIADMGIDDADLRHPDLAALVGHGKMFAKGKARTLVAQRNANTHIRIYAALRLPEDAITFDPDHAKEQVIEYFAAFAPNLRNLILAADLLAIRPMYAMPVGHRWTNRPGVTLIGDAAHLMSPFGGEGANLAMADGADLAMALVQGSDWRKAVMACEAIIAPRAEEAARGAAQGLRGAVAEDAADHVLDHMREVQARAAQHVRKL